MILLDWHAKPITLTSELPTIRLHYHKIIFSYWGGLSKQRPVDYLLDHCTIQSDWLQTEGKQWAFPEDPGGWHAYVTEMVTLTRDQCGQAWQYTHGTHKSSETLNLSLSRLSMVWMAAVHRGFCISAVCHCQTIATYLVAGQQIWFVLYVILYVTNTLMCIDKKWAFYDHYTSIGTLNCLKLLVDKINS